MARLVFESHVPKAGSDPDRADVACVVGLVRPRVAFVQAAMTPGTPAAALARWLRERGHPEDRIEALDDVPIPVDGWSTFDQLFAWDERPLGDGTFGCTYLGACVRSFFAEGGRRCYVVAAGGPLVPGASATIREAAREKLVPTQLSAADRETWHGAGHVLGLSDVSFLLLPDLPDLVADPSSPPPPEEPVRSGPEEFVDCVVPPPALATRASPTPRFAAPRAGRTGFAAWAAIVRRAVDLVSGSAREVQVVAALPLARTDRADAAAPEADNDLLRFLRDEGWLDQRKDESSRSIASAFVQLVHPWVITSAASGLPERIQPADGAAAGLLARNALGRGTYRSAADLRFADVLDVSPALPPAAVEPSGLSPRSPGARLIDRISIVGPSPRGFRLLSDVTTSLDSAYRGAQVSRLIAAVVRAARRLGEESAFENSAPAVWASVRDRLRALLVGMWRAGALRGTSEAEAFSVRCDRSTMTQQDLDQGRLIAQIELSPVQAIERITVALVLGERGSATVEDAA
jgi:hypothetical protein